MIKHEFKITRYWPSLFFFSLGGILGPRRSETSKVNKPGAGYSKKNLVEVCGPLPKMLTLFMT